MHIIHFLSRTNELKEDSYSMFSKSGTNSQKSLLASTCSNTSLICDVFDDKHRSKYEIKRFQESSNKNNTFKTHSSGLDISLENQPLKLSNKEHKTYLRGSDIAKRDSPSLSAIEKQPTSQDNLIDADGNKLGTSSRRASSDIYQFSDAPLLATRRRRSSIGLSGTRCSTRSGTSSGRIKSGKLKTRRPSFVANTLINHVVISPKLSTSNDRGARVTSGGNRSKKKKTLRCSDCRKRINITNMFICRCEKTFCAKHRHAESHCCTYDYKADGKKYLEKANPIIPIPKLPKI